MIVNPLAYVEQLERLRELKDTRDTIKHIAFSGIGKPVHTVCVQ